MIRNNYEINENEQAELNNAKHAQDIGVIELEEQFYSKCTTRNCRGLINLVNGTTQGYCGGCSCYIRPHKIYSKYIVKINAAGIFQYIINLLKDYSPTLNKGENLINITKDGKNGKVVIVDYCLNSFYFEPELDDFIIRIVVDDSKCKVRYGVSQYKFVKLQELINGTKRVEFLVDSLFAHPGNLITESKVSQFEHFITNLDREGKKLEKETGAGFYLNIDRTTFEKIKSKFLGEQK